MRRTAASVLLHVALVVAAIAVAAPLVWMALLSLLPTGGAVRGLRAVGLAGLTLEHYRALFTRLSLARAFANSLGIALAVTAISLLLNAMAGYAFAKLRFAGRDRIFRLLLGALVVPAQVGMLPLFLMLKAMGLVNTYLGVVIPGLASIFGIFLIRQHALAIPESLLDAARIDGAGEWRIFRTIVVRWLRPILVTLAVFTFMGTWNDFMWPLVILADERRYTLPVAIANLLGEHAQDTELMMAGAVLTVLPVLLLFVALQRYYIESVAAGALKE
jgi:multiple sugar transport system permease protein